MRHKPGLAAALSPFQLHSETWSSNLITRGIENQIPDRYFLATPGAGFGGGMLYSRPRGFN